MVASPSLRVANQAAATADTLRKRERQVMASAMAFAMDASALRRTSISFVAKKSVVKALIYLSPLPQAEGEDGDDVDGDAGEEDQVGGARAVTIEREPATADPARERSQRAQSTPSSLQSKPSSKVVAKSAKPAANASKRVPPPRNVDKNALSGRGSPTHGEPPPSHTPNESEDASMGDSADGTWHVATPKRPRPAFKPWRSPMFRAQVGPPPPAQLQKPGQWQTAKDASLMYGNPQRRVWIRKSDGKVWEADGDDHASGSPRACGSGD